MSRQSSIEIRAVEPTSDDPKVIAQVNIQDFQVPLKAARDGTLELSITKPLNAKEQTLPAVFYLHGGGFCICNSITHRRICVELTLRAKVVVIFVSYSLAPEAKFPLAIQECLEAIQWTIANATSLQIDPAKLVVCGDSSGGNFAAAVSLLAKEHNINLAGQVLWYPGLDPDMNDQAAQQFAEGYGLTRKTMEAVWNMYYANPEDRYNKLVAPLRASLEELSGLPPALVVSCEADLSRESCETYARKLLQAGVDVTATRVLGVIHGPLTIPNWSSSAELVLDMTVAWLKRLLKH